MLKKLTSVKNAIGFFSVCCILFLSSQNTQAQCRIAAGNNGSPPGTLDCNGAKVWCMQQNKNWCFNNKHDYTQISNPGIFSQTCEVGYLMMLGQISFSGYPQFGGDTDMQDAIWSFTNAKSVSGTAANYRQYAITNCSNRSTSVSVVSENCEGRIIQVTTNEGFLIVSSTSPNSGGQNTGVTISNASVSYNPGNGLLKTNGQTSFTIEVPANQNLSVDMFRGTSPIAITYWQDQDASDPDAPNCQILGSVPMGGIPTSSMQSAYYSGAFSCPNCPEISITSTDICTNGSASQDHSFATSSGSLSNYTYTFTWSIHGNSNITTSTPVSATVTAVGMSYASAGGFANYGTFEVMKSDKSCKAVFTNKYIRILGACCYQPPALTVSGVYNCQYNTLTLSTNSSGPYFNWEGPNSFTSASASPYISPATAAMSGAYTVTVKAASSCTQSVTGVVSVNVGAPQLSLTGGSPVCSGGVLAIGGSVNGTYTWAGPNSFTSTSINPSVSNATLAMSGVYSATAITAAPCAGTSTSTISIVVQSCTAATGSNLSLKKTVSKTNPNHGENIIYTFIITNAGPEAATGVKIKDVLPAGLTFVSVSEGTYTAGTGDWDIGNIAIGQKTVTMTVTVN